MSNEKSSPEKRNTKPTHIVRKKIWSGKRSEFETLGVAWEREDGKGLYVKLYGAQVVEGGFYVFPNKDSDDNEMGEAGQ